MTNALIAFARAVGWGTLAGTAPYTALFMIPIALSGFEYRSLADTVFVLTLPLAVSGTLVLGSAVLFGLPLTALLARSGKENGGAYALCGLGLGGLVPAAAMLATGAGSEVAMFLAIPGAFAGLVTGTSWGRWREALRR
jgi:hypothetical protein